jgi:hypothetical protein
MKKIVLAISALFLTLGAAQAQNVEPSPSPVRFLVGMGLSGGGDKLASVKYTDYTSMNIHAGGLVYFTAGVNYRITPEFSVQSTVNYHVDQANAKNGDVKFERFPVEVIGYFHANEKWRIGGGVRYSVSPKFTDSFGAGDSYSFDNSVGAVLEGEYFVSRRFGVKMRYVKETFKGPGIKDIDGSHFGLSGNFYF